VIREWLSRKGITLPDDLPRVGIVGVGTLADGVECQQRV
jgi:hypothetical protein